ncbi:MAG: ATP-dependent DNA helicase [Acaryochloridaceae cyanobacterium SU_2_1]|nr:ATP-dependent DNA helicase [Acaryochloridaceae cyanobacterium SU_2_1]NJM95771.1 ATP-dependent DNA helicase [Acaryochloridaceae cyanobacterium CSU_5_19]
MIEVEVHRQLHAFLRDQGSDQWPHYLTIARLVARAFRLQRSAIIEISASAKQQGLHRLSYLASLMLWREAVILVAPLAAQNHLLRSEIPHLREWMQVQKPIITSDHWPGNHFSGVLLLTPEVWLKDYLNQDYQLPLGIPTLIDGADQLASWAREHLTLSIHPQDWEQLIWSYPQQIDVIREARVKLTRALFQHPDNPYGCALIEAHDYQIIRDLHYALLSFDLGRSPALWQKFWQIHEGKDQLLWSQINRQQGSFILHAAPLAVNRQLQGLWSRQAVVLMGSSFDIEPEAQLFRHQVGLAALTYVQFAAERETEAIQLYLPEGLPLPNTAQFQGKLIQQLHYLLAVSQPSLAPTVLIIEDTPLQRQVATLMAAEFGSRVKFETSKLEESSILITGWEFWQQVQQIIPCPRLLVIATLPIPSLEDPRVAGQVAYYKHHRQDWFRMYLLPNALQRLQDAIAPIRRQQGVVALLDNRVLHRSYGQQILAAISPYARLSYIDASLFQPPAVARVKAP